MIMWTHTHTHTHKPAAAAEAAAAAEEAFLSELLLAVRLERRCYLFSTESEGAATSAATSSDGAVGGTRAHPF